MTRGARRTTGLEVVKGPRLPRVVYTHVPQLYQTERAGQTDGRVGRAGLVDERASRAGGRASMAGGGPSAGLRSDSLWFVTEGGFTTRGRVIFAGRRSSQIAEFYREGQVILLPRESSLQRRRQAYSSASFGLHGACVTVRCVVLWVCESLCYTDLAVYGVDV